MSKSKFVWQGVKWLGSSRLPTTTEKKKSSTSNNQTDLSFDTLISFITQLLESFFGQEKYHQIKNRTKNYIRAATIILVFIILAIVTIILLLFYLIFSIIF